MPLPHGELRTHLSSLPIHDSNLAYAVGAEEGGEVKRFQSRRIEILVCFGVALLTIPTRTSADVSVVQQVKQGGNGPSGQWRRTMRVKGLKLRLESQHGPDTHIYIYDLEIGKRYRLEPRQKEIFVDDLASRSKQWQSGLILQNRRRVITPTGRKSEVGGMGCDEYTFDLQAPTRPSHGMQIILHDSGTVCVSQAIPDGIEFTNFVHEAQKRGFISAAAVISPSTSPIGAYFYGEQANVLVLSAKSESAYEGGPLHGMSVVESSMVVTAVNSDPIPEDAFQLPVDWKIKKEVEPR
jgi:hypothetical protein